MRFLRWWQAVTVGNGRRKECYLPRDERIMMNNAFSYAAGKRGVHSWGADARGLAYRAPAVAQPVASARLAILITVRQGFGVPSPPNHGCGCKFRFMNSLVSRW